MINRFLLNISTLNFIKIRARLSELLQEDRSTDLHEEAVSLHLQIFVANALKFKEDILSLGIGTLLVKIMITDSSVLDGPICLCLI
jgi:hypothetical protein